ncbi:hypothetical protein [Streptomyces sp. NPDC045369]|uniref:hypothetical protein n=1 Tax=Streptomyces sp. NPDC045369 TaxID=3155732 RepID=UPI0033C28543
MFGWLRPGRDHELARTCYAGRESATDRAKRKEAEVAARRRARHHRSARDVDPFDRNGYAR